jgi:hypothetical protein
VESDLYKNIYTPYYKKLSAIESEIRIREDEINTIIGTYNYDNELVSDGLQTIIEKHRNKIQDLLDFEKYLGNDLWLEFCTHRREDKYINDNYISDGLDNAEIFDRALEFFDVAENEIYKASELEHSISTKLNNLLSIPKFKSFIDSFKVGNWIRIQIDNIIYKLRLIEYSISFDDFNNITVEFSDVSKAKNGITDIKDILSQASSMATSYSSVQRQASKGNKIKGTIDEWVENGLNAAYIQIQSNDNEEVSFTKNGLLCRTYDDVTESYSPEQLKLTHNIMAYTDDNWETVRQAIGKHNYIVYDKIEGKFVNEVGYGMSADFVTAGVVSGSQIIGGDIYSDNYVKNKTGSYLNLRDGTFDFGGGSLRFENGKLIISSDEASTNITEINEKWLKTSNIYAENLQINAGKVLGKLDAAEISADNIKGGTIDASLINAGDLNMTGVITWGDLSSSVQQTIYAQSTDLPDYIRSTYIDATRVESFYIKGNRVEAVVPQGTEYSEEFGFVLTSEYANVDCTYLQISSYNSPMFAPQVVFTSPSRCYAQWNFPTTLFFGTLDFSNAEIDGLYLTFS